MAYSVKVRPARSRVRRALPKSLQALKADCRVDEVWDERGDDNGYWIYLKPGYINWMSETHCIHEMTAAECLLYLRQYVQPCFCDQCTQGLGCGLDEDGQVVISL